MSDGEINIELMREILRELNTIKIKFPEGEFRIIQLNIEELKNSQLEMKKDLSDLKKKLLDPDEGVIVKVNENTKFRLEQTLEQKDFISEHNELVKWKSAVTKVLWLIFSTILGILAKVFFMD